MSSLLLILLSAALASVVVLESVPLLRPFAGVDGVYSNACALSAVALAVIPVAAAADWALASYVLRALDLDHLRTLVFVAVLCIVIFAAEYALRRGARLIPLRPGFALLLTANGAGLGAAAVAQARMRSLFDALLFGMGAALGFAALLLALAAMHERLRAADAPAAFRDAPLALVTAGLMALGFMGFTGLVQE